MSKTILWWNLLRSDDPRFVEEAARRGIADLRVGQPGFGSAAPEPCPAGRAARDRTEGLLSERERGVFDALRTPKRRQEWLLGRMVTKDLVRALLGTKGEAPLPAALTVAAAEDGSPYVAVEGAGPLPLTVSLSHRAGLALCALVEAPGAPLGADLELCEPRPAGFAADFFTRAEVDSLPEAPEQARWRSVAEIWSLKESALKAVRLGLRADTRSIQVGARGAPEAGWSQAELELQLPSAPGRARGLARWHGAHVLTLAWLGDGRAVAKSISE